jgi:hypothetical protein
MACVMNRTCLLSLALCWSLIFWCESRVEVKRLRANAASERSSAQAVREEASAAAAKAKSDLAESRRLCDEATALNRHAQVASARAEKALALAEADHRAAIAAKEAAERVRQEAAATALQSELRLADAKRILYEARAKETKALEAQAVANKERTLAREELSAAEESRALAAGSWDSIQIERRALQAGLVELDKRESQLKASMVQAQAKIDESEVAVAKAEEAREKLVQERTLLWGQQAGLRASIDGLQQQMAEAEVAMARIEQAELARLVDPVKAAIREAWVKIMGKSQQVAIDAREWVLGHVSPMVEPVSWIAAISRAFAQAPRELAGRLQ